MWQIGTAKGSSQSCILEAMLMSKIHFFVLGGIVFKAIKQVKATIYLLGGKA
jgi:hypothetical protein